MKILISIFLSFFITSYSAAANNTSGIAPFGFKWGESKAQLIKHGIKLTDCTDLPGFTACYTKDSVKPVSFASKYLLFINKKVGLQKVVLISNRISSDITGSEGKQLYATIKTTLSKKYGEPTSYEYVGAKLYDEYDEFYQCLKYDGCGSWASFWKEKNGDGIVMQLRGISRGEGELSLIYESAGFSKIKKQEKLKTTSNDSAAL